MPGADGVKTRRPCRAAGTHGEWDQQAMERSRRAAQRRGVLDRDIIFGQ